MRLPNWVLRNRLWIVLMLVAPIAGSLTSYFVLTWVASRHDSADVITSRAEAQPISPGGGEMTLEDAQAFQEYAVFWAGDDLNGMALRKIRRMQYDSVDTSARPATDMVNVTYGDCNPKPCVAPVTITSAPYCLVRPEMSAEGLLGPSFELRGATAHWVGRGENTLALFTSASTVTVIAPVGREAVLEIAKELRAINPLGPSSPSQALGPVSVNCQ